MAYGLDDAIRAKIDRQYHLSLADGRWKGMYAGTNEKEFFAELTMWYFGTRGDYGYMVPVPEPGKEWLQNYDPDAYRLLDDIYSGRIAPKKLDLVEVQQMSPAEEGKLKSLAYDQPTTLRIVNTTGGAVNVYWLDYQGKRKSYGQIAAGDSQFQNTFVSHPFLLTNKAGKGLAIFVPVAKPGIARLKALDQEGADGVAAPDLVQVQPLPASREGTIKSKKFDNPTTLNIENLTQKTVKIFWLDYQGKRKPYGEIAAGQSHLMDTYATHPFLLTDARGRGLAIFVAVPQAAQATLRQDKER